MTRPGGCWLACLAERINGWSRRRAVGHRGRVVNGRELQVDDSDSPKSQDTRSGPGREEEVRKGARCAPQRGAVGRCGRAAPTGRAAQLPLLACSAQLAWDSLRRWPLLASASAAGSHGSFLPSAALLLQPYARARAGADTCASRLCRVASSSSFGRCCLLVPGASSSRLGAAASAGQPGARCSGVLAVGWLCVRCALPRGHGS